MIILYKLNLLFIPTFKECKLKICEPIIENNIEKCEKILLDKIKEITFIQGIPVLDIFK